MQNLIKILIVAALNFLGEGLYRASIPIIAIALETKPSTVGVSVAISKLPWLSASIIVGVAIDRYAPNIVIQIGALIRLSGLFALATLLSNGQLTFHAFLLISLIISTGDVATEVAIQTSIPSLGSKINLPNANAKLYGTQMVAGQLVAPATAGVLLATSIDLLVTFAISIQITTTAFAIFYKPVTPRSLPPRSSTIELIKKIFKHRTLLGIFAVGSLMMASYGAWSSVFALYAFDSCNGLGMTTANYGLMMSSIALGALAGAILIPKLISTIGEFSLICFASSAIFMLAIICLLSQSSALVLIALILYGTSLSAWNVVAISYRQRIIPSQMLGRVTGIYRTISWGAMPLGAFLGAAIASKYGYPAAFGAAAIISGLQLLAIPLLNEIREENNEKKIHTR